MPPPAHRRQSSSRSIPSRVQGSVSGESISTVPTEAYAEDEEGIGPLGLNLLVEPSQPLIDFIFVHGLGGGSRKTWSKTTSYAHFWPMKWLPQDPDFENARIWSFGYDATYAKKKSDVLNVDDFGRALLNALSVSPAMRHLETPIVFIGHSMGGLVIKKAYILARRDDFYSSLWNRFRMICFLATPHRGSDWAQSLSRILQVGSRSRVYVGDLKRDSEMIQSINEDFEQYYSEIGIRSFYETQKLNFGFLKALIVEKESATLGFDGEQQIPMYADHRSICKFDSTSDANYRTFRNVLSQITHDEVKERRSSRVQISRDQIDSLGGYLDISEDWENDLIISEDSRLPETCQWIEKKSAYRSWIDLSGNASILWLKGKPGTGKSVLAAYIIGELEKQHSDISYYFFNHAEMSKSRFSVCLRSIAFQMSQRSAQVRSLLSEMCSTSRKLDLNDHRLVWRDLFMSGIFQTGFSQHFWVIDGLDECSDSAERLAHMLSSIDQSLPLRILITSRETSNMDKIITAIGTQRCNLVEISTTDTLSDIKLLIEKRAASFASTSGESEEMISKEILEKSNGSLLWTVLVLNKLSHAHSMKEMRCTIEDVPQEMGSLYQSCLEQMEQNSSRKAFTLTKAIIAWVTCSVRLLTVTELREALELDLGDNFPKLRDSIYTLCGQLICIDRFDRVQVIHGTAREFLLRPELESNLAIKKVEAHTRISKSCLRYLSSDQMRPPRTRRRGCYSGKETRSVLAGYASEAFSHHLARSDASHKPLHEVLKMFLEQNILSWIEIAARTHQLTRLVQAAKHLKRYCDSYTAVHSPLSAQAQAMLCWSMDLVRIVTKFREPLVLSPSSIYWLIAPFCPLESAIRQIKLPGSRLSVKGISNTEWDDRVACIDFNGDQVTALGHGAELLAIGLQSGFSILYYANSLQKYRQLSHGEPVKFVQFKAGSEMFVTCGLYHIRVWNCREGSLLHTLEAPRRPLGIIFDKDRLLVPSTRNKIATWTLPDAVQGPDRPWYELRNNKPASPTGTPCAISISLEHQMMAIAYRGKPIILWDLRDDEYYGICGKKLANGVIGPFFVLDLCFNPNSALELLAATYQDGEIVLLDPFNNMVLEQVRADCHTLAASPNGLLLAAANSHGTIMIYEFETMKLLSRVKTPASYIKQLAFGIESTRLLDLRGSECNIWEPAAMLRNTIGDGSSSSSISTAFVEINDPPKERPKISAFALSDDEHFIFCGKDNGQITLFSAETGLHLKDLYQHKAHLQIHSLAWWKEHRMLVSVDTSNSIVGQVMMPMAREGLIADKELFNRKLECTTSIDQLFIMPASDKLILSTQERDFFWNLDGKEEASRPPAAGFETRRWVDHPNSTSHIICIGNVTAHIYASSTWAQVAAFTTCIDLKGLQVRSCLPRVNHGQVLVELSDDAGSRGACSVQLMDVPVYNFEQGYQHNASSKTSQDHAASTAFSTDHVAHVIGICGENILVFLDTSSWFCSVDLKEEAWNSTYVRHFYVPYEWSSGSASMLCMVNKTSIDFARERKALVAVNDELALINGGFESGEDVSLADHDT